MTAAVSTARIVRVGVTGVCALCIAGMIVSTALRHDGAALTFGLLVVAATLCLMTATAVTRGIERAPADDEHLAQEVEGAIQRLVAAGADEAHVRALARDAVRLGSRRRA